MAMKPLRLTLAVALVAAFWAIHLAGGPPLLAATALSLSLLIQAAHWWEYLRDRRGRRVVGYVEKTDPRPVATGDCDCNIADPRWLSSDGEHRCSPVLQRKSRACQHPVDGIVDVESVLDGEVLARLCSACSEQLPTEDEESVDPLDVEDTIYRRPSTIAWGSGEHFAGEMQRFRAEQDEYGRAIAEVLALSRRHYDDARERARMAGAKYAKPEPHLPDTSRPPERR